MTPQRIRGELRELGLFLIFLSMSACADRDPMTPAPPSAELTVAMESAVRAYVSNEGSDGVSVIDAGSNTVVADIAVGDEPRGIAIRPDGARAYVVDRLSDQVTVIATSINLVVATIPVGDDPRGIAISPDGDWAYVVSAGGDEVSVIDLDTNSLVATIDVGGDWVPGDIEVSPSGDRIYATSFTSPGSDASFEDALVIIDVSSRTVADVLPMASDPGSIAFSPDGARAYIAHSNPGIEPRISVVETATNTVTAVLLPGMENLLGTAISPDGSRLYVAANLFPRTSVDQLFVIDAATISVLETIPMGDDPFGVAITPDGSQVYVANRGSDDISVIETATHALVATIAVGEGPREIAIGNVTFEASDAIDDLAEAIDYLEGSSVIDSEQAEGLRNKLETARRQLERGNTAAALALLDAFINQLEGFVGDGSLTPAEAAPLIAAAREIIDALNA